MDQKQLVERLTEGHNDAFEYLYDHFATTLFGIILRIVPVEKEAENILQDCFVKVYRHIGSYDENKGKLATWLINIARNTAIDHKRSKGSKIQSKIQNLENIVSNEYPISYHAFDPNTLGLRELVGKLEEKNRQVIEWMYFDGLTQLEISDLYNLPLGTVKTRARNGLIALRELFTDTN